jgi:hypothetical protein
MSWHLIQIRISSTYIVDSLNLLAMTMWCVLLYYRLNQKHVCLHAVTVKVSWPYYKHKTKESNFIFPVKTHESEFWTFYIKEILYSGFFWSIEMDGDVSGFFFLFVFSFHLIYPLSHPLWRVHRDSRHFFKCVEIYVFLEIFHLVFCGSLLRLIVVAKQEFRTRRSIIWNCCLIRQTPDLMKLFM